MRESDDRELGFEINPNKHIRKVLHIQAVAIIYILPNSLMCALKHDSISLNSNTHLELVYLKLYKQKEKMILPDALKSTVIIKHYLSQQFREPLITETIWQVKLQDNEMK